MPRGCGLVSPNTVQEAFFAARLSLNDAAQEEAAFEARLLTLFALNMAPEAFYSALDAPVSASGQAALDALVARRRAGEPLQYLLGEWDFMGLPFFYAARRAHTASGHGNACRARTYTHPRARVCRRARPLLRHGLHRHQPF